MRSRERGRQWFEGTFGELSVWQSGTIRRGQVKLTSLMDPRPGPWPPVYLLEAPVDEEAELHRSWRARLVRLRKYIVRVTLIRYVRWILLKCHPRTLVTVWNELTDTLPLPFPGFGQTSVTVTSAEMLEAFMSRYTARFRRVLMRECLLQLAWRGVYVPPTVRWHCLAKQDPRGKQRMLGKSPFNLN